MLKNILIGVLLVLTVLLGIYAYVQRLVADKQRLLAIHAQLEAEKQYMRAEEAVAECQKNNPRLRDKS